MGGTGGLVALRARLYLFRPAARPDWSLRVSGPLAQSAERFHGKEKVNGSIPLGARRTPGRLAVRTRGDVAQSVRANDS